MDFTPFVEQIKSKYKKKQQKTFDAIECFDSLQLASLGSNDTEGYQVFTPEFIVKQMTEAIGDEILDFSKNVLEPTSGDGAFTTYILRKRLETIEDNFEIDSLKALATIYSIEMDKDLIVKQRSNIFTLIKMFVAERKIDVDPSYFDMIKCIITSNFLWAMFNSYFPIGGFIIDVAYKMPNAEKKDYRALDFPVWSISKENISVHEEGVEIW